MKQYILSILICLTSFTGYSQTTGIIRGSVKDINTQEAIIGAVVSPENSTEGTITDFNGNFKLSLPIGSYNIKVSSVGFDSDTKYNIQVISGNEQIINFQLQEDNVTLKDIVISVDKEKQVTATDMFTPLSVQQLTTQEIRSNPGGNFDVSRVVQTLPGVGSNSAGGGSRNDILIRGGAPNENVYYLDGVEVPIINHFQTQGSSGGAQGILNVSFIEDLKLTTSAFDAKYDNALASTFVINQRDGNPERVSGSVRAGLTETAGVLEGPLGKKTTFLVSARQSYTDLLFTWLDLPIRPNYFDYQYKVTHKFDKKNSLTAIGVGNIDNFSFSTTANSTPENVYTTRSLPYYNQWSYTTGFVFKHQIEKGFINVIASRNMFQNYVDKYKEGLKDPDEQTLKLSSAEIENKLKVDYNKYINGWKISAGLGAQYVKYNIDFFSQVTNEITDESGNIIIPAQTITTNSDIDFFKYGAFAQVAKGFFDRSLLVSAGVRTDMNSFTDSGSNPLKTLSPRLSLKYSLTKNWALTGSVGTYYKLPTYTSLGYRDKSGVLANKNMEYIQSTHYVLGTEYLPNQSLRFVVEGFYKQYDNYPVSVENGISLANLGNEFGAIGSEDIVSVGTGETYGVEFSAQQKMTKNLFYVVSYTYVESRYAGLDGKLIPSSWDNRHLVSATLGYMFKRGYELGLKYRFAGGNPYTPYDETTSRETYMLLGSGTLDYSQINTLRLMSFNQLDFRVNKKYNFKDITLEAYIDIQNILAFENESMPTYTFKRNADNTGFETTDGQPIKQDGSNAIPVILENKSSTVIPTIGVMLEF